MAPVPACHNCRRQRLKCDKSFPQCLKCHKRGVKCLGYKNLFRWEVGVASRGKMKGRTFEPTSKPRDRTRLENVTNQPLVCSLSDPLVQDMEYASKKYLFYFASDVCKDLVLYDSADLNEFRQLIPFTHEYPVLLQVIIANSALHMSNMYRKSTASVNAVRDSLNFRGTALLTTTDSITTSIPQKRAYQDSLVAKHRSLRLLRSALGDIAVANVDVTLAVILLLIECELIDSGRDSWAYHVNGARTFMKRLFPSGFSAQTPLSPLRKCLISNCLVFDILGSTLASPIDSISASSLSTESLSLLQAAEGNHCSSMPAILLQIVQAGAQLLHISCKIPAEDSSAILEHQEQVVFLLHSAESFDPLAWATSLQSRSPTSDLEHRRHVAAAHRAAVCVYLYRILQSICSSSIHPCNLESLAEDIIDHLSVIQPSDALFTATTWPAFIAGAETNDPTKQAWARRRFEELWRIEPWGLMRGALDVLSQIWSEKRCVVIDEAKSLHDAETHVHNWLTNLKERGIDWLII